QQTIYKNQMNGSPAGIGAVNGKKRAVEISQMLDGYIPAVEERKARKLLRRVLPDGRAGRKRPARRKGNKQRNSKSSASCPNEKPGLPCRGRPGFFQPRFARPSRWQRGSVGPVCGGVDLFQQDVVDADAVQ